MKPEEVLQSIEKIAPEQGLPIIGPKRGAFLDEVLEKHNPSTILEVGTLVGYSAIRMARHLKPGQKLTCLEVREDMARVALSNLTKAGLSDRVEILVGDAKVLIPTLKGPFDMVFLDAAKDEYIGYLRACEGLLHEGSVVVADNVLSHANEVAEYLEYVRNSGNYKSSYHESPGFRYGVGKEEPDAVEISVKT
ncbi:MAG: O-methyltransferase [archaeon]|nr:MAG: O-methyltransferase [archaeon]